MQVDAIHGPAGARASAGEELSSSWSVLESRVLEAAVRGLPHAEILRCVAGLAEARHPGTRCAVLVVEAGSGLLRVGAAPGLPESYARIVTGLAENGSTSPFGIRESTSEPRRVADVGSDGPWELLAPILLQEGLPAALTIPVCAGDGELRGVLAVHAASADELPDEGSEVLARVVEIAGIVIERVRLDRELHESALRYRSVAESLHEALIITDTEGVITYVNPRATVIFGYEPEEMIGERAGHLLLPPETDHGYAQRLTNRKLGRAERYELENVRKDGSRVVVQVSGTPLRDAEDRIVGTIGLIQDVTEKLQLAAGREAAEVRYRRLFHGSPYAVIALDAEGRVTDVNPAGVEILGQPAEDVIGSSYLELVGEADRDAVAERLAQVLAGEANNLEVEFHVCRPSGDQRLLHLMLSAIQDATVVGAHGVARDITSDRARERQLRRAERLASLGTLISGVAHELNNPLTSIKSFAQLLLLDDPDDDMREGLEVMYREADRAAKIVGDLRLVARQTQEDEERAHEPADLNDIVRHVLRVRAYSLKTHNVEVREDLAAGLPLVTANRSQIEQVLMNLVVNAEQAMATNADEKRLIIRTRPTRSGSSVYVVDNGPGIATENLERIFDPFWTTKAPGEGTGLGLSLSHSIVAEHGGEIRVESEPGRGAAFAIDLPRATESIPTDTSRSDQAPETPGLCILIVDDEAPIRKAVSRFMQRRGHIVREAADGVAALRQVEEMDFDVILSDLRMPGMPGDKFAARLKALGRGLERRLIFITGDAASPEAARILSELQAPVVLKPFTPQELVERIERLAPQTVSAGPNVPFA